VDECLSFVRIRPGTDGQQRDFRIQQIKGFDQCLLDLSED